MTVLGSTLAALAICIMAVGYAGNLLMIVSVLAFKHLRTRSNALQVSLCVSDLLFLVAVVPFFVASYITNDWPYHKKYCEVTANLSFILIGVSLFHLTAISMFRYFSVVYPAKEMPRNRTSVFCMIAISWAVPAVMPLTTAVSHWASAAFSPQYSRCVLMKNENPALFNSMVIGGFGIPCLCTTLAYLRICLAVRKSRQRVHSNQQLAAQPPGGDDQHGSETDSDRSAEVHLSKVCGLIFVSFLVCYTPYALLNLLDLDGSFPQEAYMTCTTLFWISSTVNPVLFGLMNRQVRQAYRRIAMPWRESTTTVEAI